MTATNDDLYQTRWERYWSTVTGAPGEIFWDADPAHASEADLTRFRGHFAPELPLLDVGCGNGTQTRYLAQHFATVIGTEVAPAALDQARAAGGPANLTYRLLELLHPEEAQALHAEIGDANIYIRTVLHQLAPADQEIAVRSLAILLGNGGTLYLIELSAAAETLFAKLTDQYGTPPGLARVLQSGITPGRMNETSLESLFSDERFSLLATGETYVQTTNTLPTGEVIRIPAFYAVLRNRQP